MIREKRNIELSTIYFLETSFASSWSGVNVVSSFAQVLQVDNPVVCIKLNSTDSIKREIGNYAHNKNHLIIIDIFATSSAQRNDLSDFILDSIYNGYIYYEHAYDSNKDYTRTANGRIRIDEIISDEMIAPVESSNKKEQYRHQMSFVVTRY